ncbi:MAG: helix-turn-helix transcriptional regulator [Clostridiales bacterium]|nr:helix-turn-helix transcriptional regulator [Clostridiales bacterium]
MNGLYETISELCKQKGISGYKLCKEIGIQPSLLTDLKMGRQSSLSAKNMDKVSKYFDVSVGYLLGTETKKAPTQESERQISDDDIKFALFGGDGEITDDMYEEVKRFAHMVKLREEAEKKKE